MGYLMMIGIGAANAAYSWQHKLLQDKAESEEYEWYVKECVRNKLPVQSSAEYFRPRREEEAREKRHREQMNAMHELSDSVKSIKYRRSW